MMTPLESDIHVKMCQPRRSFSLDYHLHSSVDWQSPWSSAEEERRRWNQQRQCIDRVFLACILWWKHPFRCNRSFNCKPRSTRGARLPTCLNWDEEMDRSTWVILTYELTNRFLSKPVFSESTWTLRSCSIPNVVFHTVNLIIFEKWTSKKR